MTERPLPPPPPELPPDAHKGIAGRVLVFAGQPTMPGAAILLLSGALRAGAGLVTLAVFERELLGVVPPAVPEATYLDLSRSRDLIAGRLPVQLTARGDHVRAAGPGLGVGGRTRELVRRLVQDELFTGPLVLDADALNAVGDSPEVLAAHPGPLVCTPHPGEAERLLGRRFDSDPNTRAEVARELARRTGGILCLKGAGTVVSDGERTYVCDTGGPALATAGSGDVLTGIVAAYLAATVTLPESGFTPFDAACAAVRAHGLAGDLAARERGTRGVIARDLLEFLPAAQKHIAAGGGGAR